MVNTGGSSNGGLWRNPNYECIGYSLLNYLFGVYLWFAGNSFTRSAFLFLLFWYGVGFFNF